MMQQLVRNLRSHAISSDKLEHLHDSGTESDEDELQQLQQNVRLPQQEYQAFLSGASPPALVEAPVTTDIDDVSWDSVGRESGILTGDGSDEDSDDEASTPKTTRRMSAPRRQIFSKEQCEFPVMSMAGEKRRHDANKTPESSPTRPSSRRSLAAVRRCRVRLLVNRSHLLTSRQPSQGSPSDDYDEDDPDVPLDHFRENHAPPHQKRRRFSRPTLDFDKMLRTRLDETAGSVSSLSTPPQGC